MAKIIPIKSNENHSKIASQDCNFTELIEWMKEAYDKAL